MFQTIMISLAIIASLAAIVFLLKIIAKRQAAAKKAAMWEDYRALVAMHKLNPDLVEDFQHRIVALDAQQLQFIQIQHAESQSSMLIDLAAQRDCQLMNAGHTISTTAKSGRAKTEEYINSISLVFTGRDGEKRTVPFYSEAMDGIEVRQQLKDKAAKWQSLLEGFITKKQLRA